ncbi:MAG: pilus assembly protein PilP [Deltaproteobacteria bacterium]|nr:MAG: pilus assembly protein PilP [Deltaproteobacteria bacterium]
MEELFDRIVRLPLGAKLGAVVGIVVVVTAVNYFVWPGVSEMYDKIEQKQRELSKLEQERTKKRAIANNLNQYRRRLELLEQELAEALTEMPEDLRMDDLLTQLSELAKKAGLNLTSIEPQSESRASMYYKIPIKMEVEGAYHEIGVFLDSVGKLRRIVNVTDISLGSPKARNEKIILKAEYLATTFRFAGDEAGEKGKKGKKGRRK